MKPALDFETYSEAGTIFDPVAQKWRIPEGARKRGLEAVGAPAYSEHPTTEVLTGSYDLLDGYGIRRLGPHLPPPEDLFVHVTRAGAELESHNAMFERLIWTNVCIPRYGWPPLPPIVQRCSMATARTNSLPGKLEFLGDVLRLDTRKDKEGKRLLDKFSIPRNPTKKDPRLRILPPDAALLAEAKIYIRSGTEIQATNNPALYEAIEFERLCLYCDQDVRTEQAASAAMVPMSPYELESWQINQEMNWRGIGIDRAGVQDCRAVLDAVMDYYSEECRRITGGIGPAQVQALVGWIQGRMHGPTFRPNGGGGYGFSGQYDPDLDDDVPF